MQIIEAKRPIKRPVETVQHAQSKFHELVEHRMDNGKVEMIQYRYYPSDQKLNVSIDGRIIGGIIGQMAKKQWINLIS
jgi:hypothetical protein